MPLSILKLGITRIDVAIIDVDSQKEWNGPHHVEIASMLENSSVSPQNKARQMTAKSEMGSAWLNAIPNTMVVVAQFATLQLMTPFAIGISAQDGKRPDGCKCTVP
ncbi:hypothetical protein HELRODRAFT_170780 [Helobdella robusta]|uniref:Uncharacterized protein n=1 Tax=Helobdella robusta TaxID=6412 RepID=T1F3F1_HELRO|nr:hypothetical protein HELRODRAFT_170780 [Helobdella robusta]ESO06767.1 hypothetical protein HELRODRAFT_170780 [Helobdella robusta]